MRQECSHLAQSPHVVFRNSRFGLSQGSSGELEYVNIIILYFNVFEVLPEDRMFILSPLMVHVQFSVYPTLDKAVHESACGSLGLGLA